MEAEGGKPSDATLWKGGRDKVLFPDFRVFVKPGEFATFKNMKEDVKVGTGSKDVGFPGDGIRLKRLKERRRQLYIEIHDIADQRRELLMEQRPLRIELADVKREIAKLEQ